MRRARARSGVGGSPITLLLGLSASLLAAVVMAWSVNPLYQAEGRLAPMLPPGSEASLLSDRVVNGILITMQLLVEDVTTVESRQSLRAAGSTADWSLAPLRGDRAGRLVIQTRGSTAAEAEETRASAVRLFVDRLAEVQREASAPVSQTISVEPLLMDSPARAVAGDPRRTFVGVFASGLVLTLLVARLPLSPGWRLP